MRRVINAIKRHFTLAVSVLGLLLAVTLVPACPGCDQAVDVDDPSVCVGSPGDVRLSRLNRREIDASFAQLWGDRLQPARLFVADSVAPDAFDNTIAELAIAPRLIQDLEVAAPQVVDAIWAADSALLASGGTGGGNTGGENNGGAGGDSVTQTLSGSAAQSNVGASRDSAWNLWSDGEARYTFNAPAAGTVDVEVLAWGEQAGDALAHMDIWIDGSPRASHDVEATSPTSPGRYVASADVAGGAVIVGVRFTNDLYDEATGLDRNLLIAEVRLTARGAGGGGGGGQTGSGTGGVVAQQPAFQICTPGNAAEEKPCAQRILSKVAREAWRRPATGEELDELSALYDETRADGDSFADATRLALTAIVLSPNFLLRTESVLADATGQTATSAAAVAARLSFFLWGGPPDATLNALVDDGTLLEQAVLEAQVARMLQDDKAAALRTHFVGQWFDSQDVASFSLDPGLFPGLNQTVMEGAQQQIDAYIAEFFFGDHDVLDAIDAPVTYVDTSLATFLEVPADNVSATGLTRVELPAGDPRAGILGQMAPSVVTSSSTETNPPRRGKWVLERLLCQPIPFPIGLDIPPVPLATAEQPTARDRLEVLTEPSSCQTCHASLNPVGFGLENYAADGRFRTTDHGATIDASGVFRGQAFSTPQELVQLIKADPAAERCMVEKTLGYALGRRLNSDDDASIDALLPTFRDDGRRFVRLVAAIAKSPAVTGVCAGSGGTDGNNTAVLPDDDVTGGDEPAAPGGEGEGEGEGPDTPTPGVVSGESFEAGIPADWQVVSPDCSGVGTASVIDAGADGGAHGGSRYLQIAGGGGYCDHVFVEAPLPAINGPLHVRFFMQIDDVLGPNHVTFATLPDVDGSDLRLGGQGEIVMWNRERDDATLPALSPTGIGLSRALPANTWNCVEFVLDGAAGTMSTSIDGVEVPALVLDGTPTADIDEQWLRDGSWSITPQSLRLGWEAYAGDARTVSFDDVVISDVPIGCQ